MFFPFDDDPDIRDEEDEAPAEPSVEGKAVVETILGEGYRCTQANRHCTVEEAQRRKSDFIKKMEREKDPSPKGMRVADPKYLKGNWVRSWGVLCQKDLGKDAAGNAKEERTDKGNVKLLYYCMAAKHCQYQVR
jgi:hypothetical protein